MKFNRFKSILALLLFQAPDWPRRLKRPPRSLQDGPRGYQEVPKTAQEAPGTAREPPKTAHEWPKRGPRRNEHATWMAHGAVQTLKEVPRCPKSVPIRLKIASRWPKRPPRNALLVAGNGNFAGDVLKTWSSTQPRLHIALRRPQDGPT